MKVTRTLITEIRYPASTAVTFLNADSGDDIDAIAGTVTLAGDPNLTSGGPSVFVNAGATVLFTGTQHLSALNIFAGGTARMVQDGTAVLDTDALSISPPDTYGDPGGVLDLADNDLIVHGGSLSTIDALLTAGYHGGAWNGIASAASIVSSVAAADASHLEAPGYAQVGPSTTPGDLPITSFDGQSVSTGDVIVKFTYYGDANLDGTVNSTDEAIVDTNAGTSLTGWTNGDFNYDGAVDENDVTLFDGIYVTPPTGLEAAVVSPNEIDLSWSGTTSDLATEYDLSEYIGGAWVPLDTVDTTQTNYDVTGLSPGTSYSFEVAADDAISTSATISTTATTATPPVVTASGNTTVDENSTGATYTLTLNSNSTATNANAVTGWEVDWGNGDPIYYPGASPTETFSIPTGWSGLAIVATAETAATSSVPSYPVQADPIYVNVVPAAPTSVSATPFSGTAITISWTDTSQCDSNIVLLRSTDNITFTPFMTLPAGSGSYLDTGLSASTPYYYMVEAEGGLNGQTTSTSVATGSVTTQSSNLGLALSAGSFDATGGTINATWTYAGNDVSQWELEAEDVTVGANYQLVESPGSGTQSASISAVTGDAYNIRLRADYTDGTVSGWDTLSETLTPTLFPTVTVTQDPNNTSSDPNLTNDVEVSWTVPTGADGAGVSISYKGSSTAGTGWVPLDLGNAVDGWDYSGDSPVHVNIGDGQNAVFRVQLDCAYGGFVYSQPITQEGTAGPAPTITWTQNSDGSVSATWAASQASGISYRWFYADQSYDGEPVESGPSFGGGDPVFGNGLGDTWYGINPGDHLYLTVEELQISASGSTTLGFSQSDLPIPGAPLPGSPTNLVATLTSPSTVFLHWLDNSYDETGFDIYRSDDPTFGTDVSLINTTGYDVNQYTDTLPDETTTYYYRVYAVSSVAAAADAAAGDDELVGDELAVGESTGYTANSQGGLALKSVQFGGITNDTTGAIVADMQSISLDSGQGTYPLNAPEWLDTNMNGQIDAPGMSAFLDGTIAPLNSDGMVNAAAEHTWPISYERSLPYQTAYMEATPVFGFFGSENGNWEIQGNSSDGNSRSFTFGPGQLVQGAGTLSANVLSVQPIPSTIDSQSLTITWRISMDGGKTWITVPVGISKNHLFVTGGSAQDAYETALFVGCVAGNGQTPGGLNRRPLKTTLHWPRCFLPLSRRTR